MACYHPLTAYRSKAGAISLHKAKDPDSTRLELPCGGCLGCRLVQRQAWALRCQLELVDHPHAIFATATYSDDNLPLTLSKRDLQLWIKRLRKTYKFRFFATGEYGERTSRPHYHAIMFGISELETPRLEKTWGQGHVRVYPATPANIAYTAGYCQKKIDYKRFPHEKIEPTTGEVYEWQPPFITMSKNPGLGHKAKKYLESWRLYAVKDGHKMPVPRYLHDAWKAQATPEQLEQLNYEKSQLKRHTNLEAAEKIAIKQQELNGDKRRYG